MSHPSLIKDILHTINTMTDDIFDGMDIDANPDSIKGEAAPTAEELISQFQGNDLHELTTPPKLQHQSPKDSLSGTPRKQQSVHDWHDSGQNTPIRPLSFGGQNIGNISSGITGNNGQNNNNNNAGNGQYLKQENMQNRINPTIQNLNNSNNTSLNSSIAPSNISTSNISNWAHGGWDSGIASAQQTTGHNSVASRSVAGSAMPKQWGNVMNNQSNNQSYAQSEMSVQSRFSLPSIASTSAVHNNRESLNRADDNGSCLSWTGSEAPSGAPSRSGSRYPPMVPSNFPPQLIVWYKKIEIKVDNVVFIKKLFLDSDLILDYFAQTIKLVKTCETIHVTCSKACKICDSVRNRPRARYTATYKSLAWKRKLGQWHKEKK